MYNKELKEVTERQFVTVSVSCDCCKKEKKVRYLPKDWVSISAHHNDWGNDSCESAIEYLACSPACYIDLLKKAVEDFTGYPTAEINDMRIDFVILLIKYLNLSIESASDNL